MPAAADAAPDPDAAIIATVDRYVAAELEWQRLLFSGDEARAEAFADGEREAAMEAVAGLPRATKMAGLGAKARANVAFCDPDPPDVGPFDEALWEVLTALAGPEVQTALQQQRAAVAAVQS